MLLAFRRRYGEIVFYFILAKRSATDFGYGLSILMIYLVKFISVETETGSSY